MLGEFLHVVMKPLVEVTGRGSRAGSSGRCYPNCTSGPGPRGVAERKRPRQGRPHRKEVGVYFCAR